MQELLDWIESLPEGHDSHQKNILAFNDAMRDLIAYGESAVEPVIHHLLHSNNWWMQWGGIWVLRDLEDWRGLDALWSIFYRSKNHLGLQHQAIIALSMFKAEGLFDILVPLLSHENVDMRQLAINAFGNLGDRRAVDYLLPLLNDPDEDLRLWAILAAGKLKDERVLNVLAARLPKVKLSEKSWIIGSIGDCGGSKAVEALARVINAYDIQSLEPSQYDRLRCQAVYALASIAHPDAIVVLEAALHHGKRGVRRTARKALAKLDSTHVDEINNES